MNKDDIFIIYPKNIIFIFLWIYFLFLNQGISYSQNFVQDTLIISFKDVNTKEQNFFIDSILDQRAEQPNTVGIYEKSQYLFVPVDLLLYMENPLNLELYNKIIFSDSLKTKPHLKLTIEAFELTKKTNSLFYPRYYQNSKIIR